MARDNGRLRIGAVSYLNTKPLVYDLERLAPHAEIIYDVPSRLAAGLEDGQLHARPFRHYRMSGCQP